MRTNRVDGVSCPSNSYTCCSRSGESDHIGAWAAAPAVVVVRLLKGRPSSAALVSASIQLSPPYIFTGRPLSTPNQCRHQLLIHSSLGIRVGATLGRCRVVGR